MKAAIVALGAIVLVRLVGLGAAARAQSATSTAEIEFDKGRSLMSAGRYADACDAFGRSEAIDPQIGTRYNLGLCLEKQGKLSSAWTMFREVAQRDGNAGRRADAQKRADALAHRLTKLVVSAAAPPTGLVVRVNELDATKMLGVEMPVDAGSYRVSASAPGHRPWSSTVSATAEGATIAVAIPTLERTPPAPPPAVHASHAATEPAHTAAPRAAPASTSDATTSDASTSDAATEPASGGGERRTAGLVVASGGGALAVGGVVVGYLARAKWNDARAVCGGAVVCATDGDTARANQLGSQARVRADVATGLVGAGAVAVGIGAALWLTAHPRDAQAPTGHDVAIVPVAGSDGASLILSGRF